MIVLSAWFLVGRGGDSGLQWDLQWGFGKEGPHKDSEVDCELLAPYELSVPDSGQ